MQGHFPKAYSIKNIFYELCIIIYFLLYVYLKTLHTLHSLHKPLLAAASRGCRVLCRVGFWRTLHDSVFFLTGKKTQNNPTLRTPYILACRVTPNRQTQHRLLFGKARVFPCRGFSFGFPSRPAFRWFGRTSAPGRLLVAGCPTHEANRPLSSTANVSEALSNLAHC